MARRANQVAADKNGVKPYADAIVRASLSSVMAGLDPAIHVFVTETRKQDVDARHKAGHDECTGLLGDRSQGRRS
jgi:hypothetical protein